MILTEERTEQVIVFCPNYVQTLHDSGFTRAQAADAVHSALACLFAVIWKIPPDLSLSEREKKFILSVQMHSLDMFYGKS